MYFRLIHELFPSFFPSKLEAPALARGFPGDSAESDLARSIDIYRRRLRLPAPSARTREGLGSPREAGGIKRVKFLYRNTISPIFLPSRQRLSCAIKRPYRNQSTCIALGEGSGGTGSVCIAKLGLRPRCFTCPAPTHSDDAPAKQVNTPSQAAARIRNSVAVTTGRTWVFSR